MTKQSFFAVTAGLAVALMGNPPEAEAQQKSQTLTITAPATATLPLRGGVEVTISAVLTDSWTGEKLPGRPIAFGIGQEFYLSPSGPYYTNSNGAVSFRWRFTDKGRYRIVGYAEYFNPHLSQRTLQFITVR